MPSLVPKLQVVYPAIDLREVFLSEKTKPTLERVIKYIGAVYDRASNRPEVERDSRLFSVEEFDLLMPTERAFFDELAVCEAILRHSAGQMSDEAIKAVLDAYVDSHVYVYRAGVRSVKVGNFDKWADCDLVYISHPENTKIAFTCNPVQAWLVYFLIPGGGLKMRKLCVDEK